MNTLNAVALTISPSRNFGILVIPSVLGNVVVDTIDKVPTCNNVSSAVAIYLCPNSLRIDCVLCLDKLYLFTIGLKVDKAVVRVFANGVLDLLKCLFPVIVGHKFRH